MVYGSPYSAEASNSACHFANAVFKKGHRINSIFFMHDGALNASATVRNPQGKSNNQASLKAGQATNDSPGPQTHQSTCGHTFPHQWQRIRAQYNTELLVCIGSALRQGVINEAERERHTAPCATLADGFELSGLGTLFESVIRSDRVITFGAAP